MSFKFLLAEFQRKSKLGSPKKRVTLTYITVVPIPHKSYMCCRQLQGLTVTVDSSPNIIYDHDLLDIFRSEPSASRRSSTMAHLTWKDDERIVICSRVSSWYGTLTLYNFIFTEYSPMHHCHIVSQI